MEQSVEFQSPLYLLFIDFEKAFDSVNRECIWSILRNRGIPSKIISLIKEGYNGYKCKVRHGKLSEEFETETGVKQGCILSPLLFVIVLDEVMKNATSDQKRGIQWTFTESLEDLDFADDICLLSHHAGQMQQKVDTLVKEAKKTGLKINSSKTKVMTLIPGKDFTLKIEEENIEIVDEFTYLGSVLSNENGVIKDVDMRISKARSVFLRLNKIWRTKNVTLHTRMQVFNAMVKLVLMYGSETWTITETVRKKLQTFINRCLRTILGVYWPNIISNEELWRKTKEEKIEIQIRRRKYRWLGHTLRKSNDEISKRALQWNPQGERKTGRPKETWRRSLQRETNLSVTRSREWAI